MQNEAHNYAKEILDLTYKIKQNYQKNYQKIQNWSRHVALRAEKPISPAEFRC